MQLIPRRAFPLALMLLAACGSEDKSVTEQGRGSPKVLLPLAVGNTWVYRRTVLSQDGDVFHVRPASNGPGLAWGNARVGPGVTEETYVLEEKVRNAGLPEAWRVSVSQPRARDGRYGGGALARPVHRILWGRDQADSKATVMLETLELQPSVLVELRPTSVAFLIESNDPSIGWELATARLTVVPGSRVAITTPAGSFASCSEMIATVSPDRSWPDASPKPPWIRGWKTHSYYAPGVGLVKERQVDAQGRETYVLDLLRYQLR